MGGRRAAAATKKRAASSSSMRGSNAGKAPYDSESNSDDEVMSDEDAYEDPPSDFDDEEIDEDEAFNEDDEERYGELFDEGEEEGDDAFDDDDDDHEDEERADDDDDEDDDDLNALMDSDEEEEEEAKPTSRSVRRVSEEADDEARATLSSDDDDDDDDEDARERVLDELVGKNRTRTEKLDVRYKPIRTETIPENPFAMPASRVSDEDANMTLADVMASLGGEAVFDKHTMKRLSKISKQKAPDVPLARQIQERLDRRAAYEETSKDVTKYQPHVKENREKRTLEFKSARDDMQRKDTLGALVADFTPKTEIELEIAKALKESGHATAKDIAHGEMLAMNHLDVEDIKARQAKLAKMRAVLFYHEQKAKRLKAIKSKAYHRHNRKGELKVIGGDEDDDAEDGAEGDTPEERREYLRAQERMLLRHKNTSRWAQRAIKKGIAHLAGTREKLQEQLRIGQQLKEKIEGARTTTTELGDESTDAEDSDDDDDGGPRDDPAAERKRLLKAKAAALKAIEDGEELEGANESLFKLPFMARAMEKRKEANKAEARALLEEIDRMDGEDDDDDDDDDDLSSDSDEDEWEAMTAQAKRAADSERASTAKRARLDAGKETAETTTTLKKQKKSSSKAKPVEEISKAARNMRAKAAARVTVAKLKEDDASSDSDAEADKPTVMLDEERADGMSNQDLMRRAFENDDIEAEFEKEKLADVNAELPDVDMPKNLPGWGTWAGDQKTPKWMKDAEKKAKAEKAKALKSRRDAKLKHVVISEKFDKKAAQFNVESLPHGFASKATYEGTMRQPLGLDSNTHGMFKKMNQPKVLKATGSIIKPFKMPKHKQKKSTKGR